MFLSASTALGAETDLGLAFGALEKSGAVIGEVRVDTRNIFDLDDPAENGIFYRAFNRLHLVTRRQVIARMLLFKSGEPVSARKVEETERILRGLKIIHDLDIRPAVRADGKVDIDVTTRDAWSLDVTGSFSRSGGNNKSSFGFRERNLLGTGLSIGYARTSDLDRDGTQFEASYGQAFDGWTRISYDHGYFNDGGRTSFVIDRPFYALDTRFAARAEWSDDDRIDSIYNAGDRVAGFRHHVEVADFSAGWSPGLAGRWVQRFSVGAHASNDRYRQDQGETALVPLPVDHQVRAPYLRYELLEDDFVKVRNYNNIARPEFFELGFHLQAQVGRSLESLEATDSNWLYSVQVSDGTTLAAGGQLLGKASIERRIASTARPMTQGGAEAQIYVPLRGNALYYASIAAARVSAGGVADQLLLGGGEGLRGYPSRYQAGESRVLGTAELRWYSDWYLWRVVRVGGAAFADAGRAWGGPNQNTVNGGWLADAGAGLRLAIDRTARANVLHLDVAVPLKRAPGIKSVQFLVKTELAF